MHALILWLPLLAPLATPIQNPDPAPAPPPAPEVRGDADKDALPNPFLALTPEQALVEAAKTKRLTVMVFVHPSEKPSQLFEAAAMKDRATLQWLKDNAIAIHESAEDPNGWIQKHGIRDLPSVDVRSSDGRMLERIIGNVTPAELLNRLQGAQRAQNTTEEPTGSAAEDPLSWLAYAHNLMARGATADEAAKAFFWCLDNGEAKMPGFLEANLSTILQRLIRLKRFSKEVETTLRLHRDRLHDRVTSGEGTVFDSHALALYGQYMRDLDDPTRACRQLKPTTAQAKLNRQVLLWNVLEYAIAYRSYDLALEVFPDPNTEIARRLVALEIARKGSAQGTTSMPRPPGVEPEEDAETDGPKLPKVPPAIPLPGVRTDADGIAYDAALLFEVLVTQGRGTQANALMVMVTDYVPTADVYGYFIERAHRVQALELAQTIADRGTERVPEADVAKILATLKRTRPNKPR
ncbi:MAG: hypothetical protein R3F33_08360 [Planctomycetota bacterium]